MAYVSAVGSSSKFFSSNFPNGIEVQIRMNAKPRVWNWQLASSFVGLARKERADAEKKSTLSFLWCLDCPPASPPPFFRGLLHCLVLIWVSCDVTLMDLAKGMRRIKVYLKPPSFHLWISCLDCVPPTHVIQQNIGLSTWGQNQTNQVLTLTRADCYLWSYLTVRRQLRS